MDKNTVVLVGNSSGGMYVFRGDLIRALSGLSINVVVVCPKEYYSKDLSRICTTVYVDSLSKSLNPILLIKSILSICFIVKKYSPLIVHSFTHQANLACMLSYPLVTFFASKKVCFFSTITGLGDAYIKHDIGHKFIRLILNIAYRLWSYFCMKIFVQNVQDFDHLRCLPLINHNAISLQPYGSGINTQLVCPKAISEAPNLKSLVEAKYGSPLKGKIICLYPARIAFGKGLEMMLDVAKKCNDLWPNKYLFLHIGIPPKDNDAHLCSLYAKIKNHSPNIITFGHVCNPLEFISFSDLVVLPSLREGLSRSLLESLALDKIIVTTRSPGCEDLVVEGWNGYLFEYGNVNGCLAAIHAASNILPSCGKSRSFAISSFDSKLLIDDLVYDYMLHSNIIPSLF